MTAKLSGTHVTVIICTAIVALSVLVFTGKVVVPDTMVKEAAAVLGSFLTGLMIKRPNRVRKLLGLPVKDPADPFPPPYDPKG